MQTLTRTPVRPIAPEPISATPEPAPAAPPRAWREHARFALPIVGLVLWVKAMVFVFGMVVGDTVGQRTYPVFWDRFAFWSAWDAPHYLDIARNGYVTTGDAANWIVFFPAYPYATRVLDWVAPGGLLTAAFLVSGIASVAAALLLAWLVRIDGGDRAQATRAVWFLLIFPTAYFLHLPYTESLFVALTLGAFVAARTGHWAVAGIVGAFAAMTRVSGVLLIPALMVEAYLQYRRTGRLDRSFLWIGCIGLGLAVYLGINQYYFGDPLYFQSVQERVWFRHLEDPYTSVVNLVKSLPGQSAGSLLVPELLFLVGGFVAGLLAWRFTRPSYAVWVVLNVLLFASTSWIQSTPRYAITLFPIFLMLAMVSRRQGVLLALTSGSMAMLAWFTALFALGHWAF